MAEVAAFRGIHYQPGVVPLESVLAPPYDVISPELQLDLYSRAMQNVVRIELGRDFEGDIPGQRDRYTRAADHLHAWLLEGVLAQDDQPSIYVHRHSFRPPGGGGPRERLGCFVGIEPVAHERGEVLRHELTMTAPREDRLRLLQATKTQTSPVFLLYENCAEVTRELETVSAGGAPFAEAVVEGEYGSERHQLWRVSNPEVVHRVAAALSRTRLFIADGHHRYETALTLELPWILALVSPLDAAGNVILPTHRVVPGVAVTIEELGVALATRGWRVEPVPDLSRALAGLAAVSQEDHAVAVVGATGMLLASRARAASEDRSPRLGLDVTVLETEILQPVLGVASGDAAGGRLLYSRDPQEALEKAIAEGGVAFLLNPTTVEEMAAVAAAGEAMPQKSTYFFPKVPAGLVFMSID
jgi:uncharacterized protein (DUF1015 family)